jgi:hypothetical protein
VACPIVGDLEEEFQTIVVPKYGERLARVVEATHARSNDIQHIT